MILTTTFREERENSMNTDKITKKSLLMSGLTLLISVALLASTTFAWFTDSITNSGNTIEAGELQIEVKGWKLNSKRSGWDGPIMQANFDEKHLIEETDWKGGDYGAIMLKVKNSGSVAAKISLDIDVDGGLSGALWYSLQTLTAKEGAQGAKMLEMLKYDDENVRPSSSSIDEGADGPVPMFKIGGKLDRMEPITIYPSRSEENCYVFYLLEYGMYTDVDAAYADKKITMDVSIEATQAPGEADGFGNPKYDKDAVLPTVREQ